LGCDGRVDPQRIVDDARAFADFDVLCLQEVAANFPLLEGSRGEDQFALLAAALPGFTAIVGVAVDSAAPDGTRRRFGNMILSRFPVRWALRALLPWPADPAVRSMPRVLVEALVEAPFGPVRVMTTHLEYYSALQRAAQLEALRRRHEEACAHALAGAVGEASDGPFERQPQTVSAILTGDFNLRPDDPLHARLGEGFADARAPQLDDVWQRLHRDAAQPPTIGVTTAISGPTRPRATSSSRAATCAGACARSRRRAQRRRPSADDGRARLGAGAPRAGLGDARASDGHGPRDPTRAQFIRGALALPLLMAPRIALPASTPASKMNTRPIPSTREPLPVIGCGTYIAFDAAPGTPAYALLPGVVGALLDAGGKVLDSSPMYGRAEETTGELLAASGRRGEAFLATKVWTRGKAEGIRQMEASFRLLRSDRIDLMQIHNLVDWRTHLATLRRWKDEGRIRYLGVTHYTSSAYAEVEAVLRAERLDFLQINYALDDREAEQRILPLAAERGVAVIVNMPFGGGGLLRGLVAKPLPSWAGEIGCASWAQLLLRFVLSNPAVTCAIPGTRRREHMEDNAHAGFGAVPPPEFWRDKLAAMAR
jgi:diketogulonate reductase-like aldo/keto reductase/endonuclease/exonuclease/phosphatase family metal-dependent hydrolase